MTGDGGVDDLTTALAQIDRWQVPCAGVAVVSPDGALATRGQIDTVLPVASVTKPVAALAVWVAIEEEAIALDEPAGPPGATVRHLLAHASGLAFDSDEVRAAPGERRIYSNVGFEVLGRVLEERSGIAFDRYLHEAVIEPLGLTDTVLDGSPAKDLRSSVTDLAKVAAELLRPTLVAPHTLAEATTVAFPGLAGVLPGIGAFDPLDWGLGVELKGHKQPHWSGSGTAPETFGHFGASGSFLWVDPTREVACVSLSGRDFDTWAMRAWPALSEALTDAVDSAGTDSSQEGYGPTGQR